MIELITKPDCPLCIKAKEFLTEHKLQYTEQVIGKDISRDEVKARYPDAQYVPVVLIDGKYVGGYYALVESVSGVDIET